MAKKPTWDISENEVTDESAYLSRRSLLKGFGAAIFSYHPSSLLSDQMGLTKGASRPELDQLLSQKINSRVKADPINFADVTPYRYASSYNNFYEFGSGKSDPKKNAKNFVTSPWTVSVHGECDAAGIYHLEDFVRPHLLEERIYRLRCVEASHVCDK